MMRRKYSRPNLTGQPFGRLVVLGLVANIQKPGRHWCCLCECGKFTVVLTSSLVREPGTRSCGCSKVEAARRNGTAYNYKHGGTGTPEYIVWGSMLARCLNRNAPHYQDYGGRGIKVCQAWMDSFAQFYADMGPRPSIKHTIERKDCNGNYEPANCCWATWIEQANNRRNSHFLEFNGKRLTICQWAREVGINHITLSARIRDGWSVEKALTTPINPRKRNSRAK